MVNITELTPPTYPVPVDEVGESLIQRVAASVVCFTRNRYLKGAESSGSGSIIDNEGTVLTADHVYEQWLQDVRQDFAVGLLLDGQKIQCPVFTEVHRNPQDDWAILQFESLVGRDPLAFVTQEKEQPGQRQYVVGFPYSLPDVFPHALTCAVSPGELLEKQHPVPGLRKHQAISARVWSGFSGSPVIDIEGRQRAIVLACSLSFTNTDYAWVLSISAMEGISSR